MCSLSVVKSESSTRKRPKKYKPKLLLLIRKKMNYSFSMHDQQFCLLFPYNVKIRIKIIERWKHTKNCILFCLIISPFSLDQILFRNGLGDVQRQKIFVVPFHNGQSIHPMNSVLTFLMLSDSYARAYID